MYSMLSHMIFNLMLSALGSCLENLSSIYVEHHLNCFQKWMLCFIFRAGFPSSPRHAHVEAAPLCPCACRDQGSGSGAADSHPAPCRAGPQLITSLLPPGALQGAQHVVHSAASTGSHSALHFFFCMEYLYASFPYMRSSVCSFE